MMHDSLDLVIQIAGVDFNANFAPVVNDVTFRLPLVVKIMMDWNT